MKTWKLALAAGLLGMGSFAQAGLMSYTSNGVDLVFDDDYTPVGASSPGLTWTADANLAATETFGVSGILADGRMDWNTAQEWIAAMNAAGYGGASDWRLWSALNSDGTGPCEGFFCTNSELGHLFYVEGGLSAGQNINSSADLTAVFTNMQDFIYWSGTELAPNPNGAWYFNAVNGLQNFDNKVSQYYGWAVRPGQVADAPLPGTAVLMALGLLGLGVSRQKRRATLVIR